MPRNTQTLALIVGVITGTLGLSYFFGCVILAWTEPASPAPTGNTGAPINITSANQSKIGNLSVGTGLNYWITKNGDSFVLRNNSSVDQFTLGQDGVAIFNSQVKISGGSPGNGKVLTSDANGLATWQTSSGTLPSGTSGQTLRNNGSGWLATSNLSNNGSNVGIGTTTPTAQLEIAVPSGAGNNCTFRMSDGNVTLPNYSSAGFTPALGTNNITYLSAYSGTLGGVQLSGFTSSGVNNGNPVGIIGYHGGTSPTTPAVSLISFKHDGGTDRTTLAANEISAQISNGLSNPLFTVLGGGNVGIGTTTPGTKLEIAGQVKITGGTPGAGKVLTSDAAGLATWQTPTSGSLGGSGTTNYLSKFTAATTLGNSLIFDDGTNIGIGTVTPGAKLDVRGGVYVNNPNTADTGGINMAYNSYLVSYVNNVRWGKIVLFNGSGDMVITNSYGNMPPHGIVFQTATTGVDGTVAEAMRISSDGNVGIGTDVPGTKLEVAGQVRITGGSPGAGKVLTSDANGVGSWQTPASGGISGSGTANYISKFTAATTLGNSVIYDNGTNIGIGSSNPLYKLELNGNIGTNYNSLILNPNGGTVGTDGTYGIYWHQNNGTPSASYGIYRMSGAWTASTYQQLRMQFDTGIQLGAGTGVGAGYDRSYVEVVNGKGLMVTSGNVGIGTTTPGAKLEVAGQIKITGGSPGAGKVLKSDAAGLASWSGGSVVTSDTTTAIRKGTVFFAPNQSPANQTVTYGITYDTPPVFFAQLTGYSAGTPTSLANCTTAELNFYAPITAVTTTNAKFRNINSTSGTCYEWLTVGTYTGADLAEYYKTDDQSIEPGDVVAIDKNHNIQVVKSNAAEGENVLGIVSTRPGQVLGDQNGDGSDPNTVQIALAGRVPVKVSLENGIIRKGDYLTASSVPGVAMKATKPCVTIGKALNDFDSTATTGLIPAGTVIDLENTTLSPKEISDLQQGLGKVMAFLNIDYWEPGGYETNQNEKIANQGKEIETLKNKIEDMTGLLRKYVK